jgi:hypothetical protein
MGSVPKRLKGAPSGLISFVRTFYLCGFQQLQRVRNRFKNAICNNSQNPNPRRSLVVWFDSLQVAAGKTVASQVQDSTRSRLLGKWPPA